MHLETIFTAVLAGFTCVVASPVSLRAAKRAVRTVNELRRDEAINAILAPENIETLIKNARRIEVAADADGTLVSANGIIANQTIDSMRALDVTIITANSQSRIELASNNYHNIIFEQDAGSTFNGTTTFNLTPEEVSVVEPLIADALTMLENGRWSEDEIIFVPKLAGYAIVMADHENHPIDNESWTEIHEWMIAQSTSSSVPFKVQPTTGAFDLTLSRLNKGNSFTELRSWKGPDAFWIVMGDTEETDDPMLALANMGISVHRRFGDYIHFPDVMDSTTLFEWIFEVQNAPDLD